MKSLSHTFVILTVLAMLSPSWAAETSSGPTVTISGVAGLAGVTMRGLPGTSTTDENGCYTAKVPRGWSGAVIPTKKGYAFDPPQRNYSNLQRSFESEDYEPLALTFSISGSVGAAGVTMDGLPGQVVTDSQGSYRLPVEYGWSGVVTPSREGYNFDPPARQYDHLAADCVNQNYSAQTIRYTIFGTTGLPGVMIQGLPENSMTDARGHYSVEVPYGWTGRVVPTKQGCTFEPVSRDYVKVAANQLNQGYTPVRVSVAPSSPYGAGGIDVLVIPTTQVDPKAVAEIREDMQVMVHILREMLSEPRMILGILYDYGDIFGRSDRGTRAFYLEGYGALFVTEVDFPFSFASEDRSEDEATPEQEIDPIWQRARQKLRSPGAGRAYGQGAGNEMSFEQFKADLVQTLKHAANIRHVDPNENIIVTIIGQDQGSGWSDSKGTRGGFGAFGGGSSSFSGGSFGPGGGSTYANSHTYSSGSAALGNVVYQSQPAPTTVLTIRAKKADVDAFAAGQIDLEQFQQRVNVLTY